MIIQQPIAYNASQTPQKDFNVPQLVNAEFEKLIIDYGYDVILERSLRCPCIGHMGAAANDCVNCNGTGWYFSNPINTILALQSMSSTKKYENWTEENPSTVQITARAIDRLSFMDRITLQVGETIYSQLLQPFIDNKNIYQAYTVYNILSVEALYIFESADKPLGILQEGKDYTFNKNLITFNKKFQTRDELQISLRYRHRPQYCVIDIPRDIVIQERKNCKQESDLYQFPIKAMARLTHYLFNPING